MATLDLLKQVLRRTAKAMTTISKQPLSDSQYSTGVASLKQGSTAYEIFIVPQLTELLTPLFNLRAQISILEIGPGPTSVVGYLPGDMRSKITEYVAYEPNGPFASSLEESLAPTAGKEFVFPGLHTPVQIHRIPFEVESNTESRANDEDGKFDVVLFCHSMYGMKRKREVIEKSLGMLAKQQDCGMVVVFHRDGSLDLNGLVCHRTASLPTGITNVANDDDNLDDFASFVAGFVVKNADEDRALRLEWRKVCRSLGLRDDSHPGYLSFSSPEIMMAFTQHATALPELMAQVPLLQGELSIKNREARLHRPACVVRPTDISQVQACVQWALKHKVGLAVLGGGHSGHSVLTNVVSVDMSAFDKVSIFRVDKGTDVDCESRALVVVESGCKTGDVIGKTMETGLTVPLGACPSVGAGLWLQGGIGHLARLHGLACDSIVGAVLVSVSSGQILCVGMVPSQHQPAGAICPESEENLLWALKGAGTNFGIVISVTLKAYPSRTYSIRNWIIPLQDNAQAESRLGNFDALLARNLPKNCSADAYLYSDADQLRLGVTVFESCLANPASALTGTIFGPGASVKVADGVGLFDCEMYMSGMHGGHGGGKTSSFKRCLLLKRIGDADIANALVTAFKKRPSPQCYLHLLHGGGAIGDVPADAAAFGCRDWDFACVVTGVWPRDEDGTANARSSIQWVYDVVKEVLPLCQGVYGADLGPDPRDVSLAAMVFGPNRARLARLKHTWDPYNVLAYACPLPKTPMVPRLTILVTGESCAGKDHCAKIWVSAFTTFARGAITARVVSISDVAKQEYARATGADFIRILGDRTYKEKHRPALTAFFMNQVKQRPCLLEDHFMNVVYGNADVYVLLVTGMRDEAPISVLSHLVPDARIFEVRVQASRETQIRRGASEGNVNSEDQKGSGDKPSNLQVLEYRPSLVFDNDTTGNEAPKAFAQKHLLPWIYDDIEQLSDMVQSTPDFPSPGVQFRHVLDICQQPGGLSLCTSLLRAHFSREWESVDKIVCCEAGGFIFASTLAAQVNKPLALIRKAGKLPQPTISVTKYPSHISSLDCKDMREGRIEMGRDVVPQGSLVVVVDDVLATGKTLVAVLELLKKACVKTEDICVMVVAEFPIHRGREMLYRRGFGGVEIRSLLVYGSV
ncbi:hypothetical protein IFR05_006064 [Cadophora sp. M221]|nr:hypothetical protein IFR05_006064 [Cadophora sp. M221]